MNNLGNEIYNAKLNPLQKELVRELASTVMYLSRNPFPPDGIVVEPMSTQINRIKELKQQLGLEEE